jgi:hypothetical protein
VRGFRDVAARVADGLQDAGFLEGHFTSRIASNFSRGNTGSSWRNFVFAHVVLQRAARAA